MQMLVRPARSSDLELCGVLDHSYLTDRVWQLDTREGTENIAISLRLARLPRQIKVAYPRTGQDLLDGWELRDKFLVAADGAQVRGYVAVNVESEHGILWIGDLVVDRPWRRRGIGASLLLAAAQTGKNQGLQRLVMAVPTKNYTAFRFCHSRRMTFCGYSDHYWPGQDIALFFGESLRW